MVNNNNKANNQINNKVNKSIIKQIMIMMEMEYLMN